MSRRLICEIDALLTLAPYQSVPLQSHERGNALSAIADLAVRQAELEAGAKERDEAMGPEPEEVKSDVSKVLKVSRCLRRNQEPHN